MASRLKGMNGAKQYIAYLKSEGKTGAHVGERVRYEYSTFCANAQDVEGMVSELKLRAGRKFEAYDFRISFSPDDRKLSETEFRAFCDQVTSKVIPGRNYYAVLHGDTAHDHIQIVACFLDAEGRIINNKGAGKYSACIRLQDAVDEARKSFGLSVIPREKGRYRRGRDRNSLGAVRASEAGQYIWTSDLKGRIITARKAAKDIPSFLNELKKLGVEGRLRGQGISFSFHDENEKKRIARGQKLGQRFSLSAINQQIARQNQRAAADRTTIRTGPAPVSIPTSAPRPAVAPSGAGSAQAGATRQEISGIEDEITRRLKAQANQQAEINKRSLDQQQTEMEKAAQVVAKDQAVRRGKAGFFELAKRAVNKAEEIRNKDQEGNEFNINTTGLGR